MSRHLRLIQEALKLCDRSTHEIHMAAIIAQGNRIISRGNNSHKSHPKQKKTYNPARCIHAEVSAIVNASSVSALEGATIYVARKLCDGSVGLARPCQSCDDLIRSVGLSRVYYSVSGAPDNIPAFEGYKIID